MYNTEGSDPFVKKISGYPSLFMSALLNFSDQYEPVNTVTNDPKPDDEPVEICISPPKDNTARSE